MDIAIPVGYGTRAHMPYYLSMQRLPPSRQAQIQRHQPYVPDQKAAETCSDVKVQPTLRVLDYEQPNDTPRAPPTPDSRW